MPPLVLAGSLGVLWGALIVTISMSESYDGLLAWRKGTQMVGTLVASIGTAAAFAGATIGDVSKADAKILPWGLALLSLTVLIGLLLPRFHRWREHRREKGQGLGGRGRRAPLSPPPRAALASQALAGRPRSAGCGCSCCWQRLAYSLGVGEGTRATRAERAINGRTRPSTPSMKARAVCLPYAPPFCQCRVRRS